MKTIVSKTGGDEGIGKYGENQWGVGSKEINEQVMRMSSTAPPVRLAIVAGKDLEKLPLKWGHTAYLEQSACTKLKLVHKNYPIE